MAPIESKHDALSLDAVVDEKTFLAFVRALERERRESVKLEAVSPSAPYGPDAGGWENITIEDFLGAAVAWAESTDMGTKQGLSPDNPWKRFAAFLYCGKIYE